VFEISAPPEIEIDQHNADVEEFSTELGDDAE
jgi:hypothetical protein